MDLLATVYRKHLDFVFLLDQLKGVPCFFLFEMIDLVISIDEEKLRNVLLLF